MPCFNNLLFFTLRPIKSRTQLFCALLGTSQVQTHRVPPPSPFLYTKAGRNHLNEETTPLLPQGLARDIAKPYQRWTFSALAPNSPHKRKCWTNSGGPLVNSLHGVQTNQGSSLQSYGIKMYCNAGSCAVYIFQFFLKMFSQANQHCTLQSGMLGRPALPILDFLQLWPTETQLFPQLSNPWVSLNLVIWLATKTGNLLNLTKDLTKFSFVQEIWYFEIYIYFHWTC
jgi:hypothetical protein